MSKLDKKRAKLVEQIQQLEQEVFDSLKQKSSSQAEINLPAKQRQIAEAKAQLALLK